MLEFCVQICVQVVGSLGEVLGKVRKFYSQIFTSTQRNTLELGLVHNLSTRFTHYAQSFTQKIRHHNSPYSSLLLPTFHRTYYYY
jgi:hypothetical protein